MILLIVVLERISVGKNIDDLIKTIQNNPKAVRFNDLAKVCEHYFGKPR